MTSNEDHKGVFNDETYTSISLSIAIVLSFIWSGTHITRLYLFGLAILIAVLPYLKLLRTSKEIIDEIQMKLPVLLVELNLLLGTGLSMRMALLEISSCERNVLLRILQRSNRQLKAGYSFEHTYMGLANRCHLESMTAFTRIIIQDEKNGTKDTLVKLTKLCDELWKLKKSEVLKKGEEASTKMLLPMMIALLAVIVAVSVPAIYELFSIF